MKQIVLLIVSLTMCVLQGYAGVLGDSIVVHRLEVEELPGAILHTNEFLRGNNPYVRTMNHSNMVRVKYSFVLPDSSWQARTYGTDIYQGMGVGIHDFNPLLGNPVSFYLFQGAPIARLSRRVSFNYEWNLGLAMGWNPYDPEKNRENHVIGSSVTAYLDADLYWRFRLSNHLDVNVGATFSHYSNGNTAMPNVGLNTVAIKAGMVYSFEGKGKHAGTSSVGKSGEVLEEVHGWQTDLLLFGAWKCKGIDTEEGSYAVPGTFGVMGFNLTPMYRFNQWLRVGLSLDGVYDHSANLDISNSEEHVSLWVKGNNYVHQPAWYKQVALGLSARLEFVMPFFSINAGIGRHLLYASGPKQTYIVEDNGQLAYETVETTSHFGGFYQVLALKIALTRRSFLHIGYSLYDFQYPNNLMLGLGYRF